MSELRQMLGDSVQRMFEQQVDRALLEEAEAEGWSPALWELVIEHGIDRVLVSEDRGGVGGAWQDAYVVIRQCGRYGVPLPIAEAILARGLIDAAGVEQPEGIVSIVPGQLTLNADATVSGSLAEVPWGRRSEFVAAVASEGDVRKLIVIDTRGFDWERQLNLAGEPRDTISLSHARMHAAGDCSLPDQGLFYVGAMLRAAQMAGAAAGLLERSLRYAEERTQFGRPLARNQAIQHNLARLAAGAASIDAVSMTAFQAVDHVGLDVAGGCDARLVIAAAKCRASAQVDEVAGIAHQVHGAIGFTYEYGMHFLSRRLWSWRSEFGNAAHWARLLGTRALKRGGEGIWSDVTQVMGR